MKWGEMAHSEASRYFRHMATRQELGRTEPAASIPAEAPHDGELRAMFLDQDAQRGAARDCSDVWPRIRAGEFVVVDSFSTSERAYLALGHTAGDADVQRIRPRQWEILERILLGQVQKVVALELDAAASTIATSSKATLRAIGIKARVSNVPPLLSMLVHAAYQQLPGGVVRKTVLEHGAVHYCVLSIPLKTPALAERLSPAEHVVALMRIEGHSLAEIATVRRTSSRTVANQLSMAFRRLGISGRSGLVEYFVHA
jgi:DNA-binding NarL/FixJ family response regulator